MRSVVVQRKWVQFRWTAGFFGAGAALSTIGYGIFIKMLVDVAVDQNYDLLVAWIGAAVGLYVVSELLSVGYNFLKAFLIPGYKHKVRGLLLVHWFAIVPKRKMASGAISNALFDDLDAIIDSEETGYYSLSYATAALAASVGLLFWIHWIVALVGIGGVLVSLAALVVLSSTIQRMNVRLSTARAKYYGESKEIDDNRLQYETMRMLGHYQGSMLRSLGVFKKNAIPTTNAIYMLMRLNGVLLILILLAPITVGASLRTDLGLSYGSIAFLAILSSEIALVSTMLPQGVFALLGIKPIKAKYVARGVELATAVAFGHFVPSFTSAPGKEGLTLKMGDKRKFVFKGPNGSGKSTALSLLDKDYEFSGEATVTGQDSSGKDLDRYALCRPSADSCMFQSVEEIKKAFRTDNNPCFNRVAAAVASTGMRLSDGLEGKSQGETQTLSLLHALATGPSMLILDECLSGVAKPLRRAILGVLLKDESLTLAVVDHTMSKEEEALFDEVVVFSK